MDKKRLINLLKKVVLNNPAEEFYRILEEDNCSCFEAIIIARAIYGNTSREVEYLAKKYSVRLSDVPTQINDYGDKIWRNDDGYFHREDGPAIESANGTKEWFINGKLHRIDGPAVERADGSKYWYLKGRLHRADGPAIEYANGSKYWYLNGQRHRLDGPAIEESDGTKEWFVNGERVFPELNFLKKS